MASKKLADGGTRVSYGTGAKKEDSNHTDGKGAYHLLPTIPIRRVAEVYRKGAVKYAARNWEKGIPLSRLLDSAKRHIEQYQEGMINEDHAAQAIWNMFGIIHTEEMIKRGLLPPSLNDLPSYGKNGVEVEVYDGLMCSEWREQGPGINLKPEHKGLWPEQLELLGDDDGEE